MEKTSKLNSSFFFYLFVYLHDIIRDKATFNIDLKALKRQFLLLQQKAHPDSFSQAPKVCCLRGLFVNNKLIII